MLSPTRWAGRARAWVAPYLSTLRAWPWLATVRTLHERFREDRLGVTASSLTFTTLISLVPLVTVGLAAFTAFPMFAELEETLRRFVLRNLVPDGIAAPVLDALGGFAEKARGMGKLGLMGVLVSALALVLTIDRTLNDIWRVRQGRSFGQRVLVYWAVLTLGPLALAASLSLTAVVVAASRPFASTLPGGFTLIAEGVQFLLLAGGMAALFLYVPNTAVRRPHAWAGGVFVAVAFEVAKKLLTLYLENIPAYDRIYGTFATVPILMLWVFLSWVIVLLGAVIAAYAPSLQMRVTRRPSSPGWRFELSLGVLRQLHLASGGQSRGLTMPTLARALRLDPLQLEPVLEELCALDWVGRLDERATSDADARRARETGRFVLLCDPERVTLEALVERTLLEPGPASSAFVAAGGLPSMTLAQAMGTAVASPDASVEAPPPGPPRAPGRASTPRALPGAVSLSPAAPATPAAGTGAVHGGPPGAAPHGDAATARR